MILWGVLRLIKVACHSAVYLPWIGYFYKMSLVDHFVILDDAPITRGGIGNRNYIMSQGERLRLAVPTKGRHFSSFRDIQVAGGIPWRKKHVKELQQAYAKHPYYEAVGEWLFPVYERDYKYLIDLNSRIVYAIRDYLGFKVELHYATVLEQGLQFDNATERLAKLTKACGGGTYISGFGGKDYLEFGLFGRYGTECQVYDFRHPVYPQVGAEEGFVSRLTVIDLLFNCGGKRSAQIIKENRGKQNGKRR